MAWSSWYTSFSDAFKKRAGRYLINRYLGTFLDETISLDQLSVDGAISLKHVALNIRTINSLIDDADLPVEFVDGYIQDLSVTIPWSNLLTESCFFSISGLTVTVQVKKRDNPAQISASIFQSMCESFSSINMAEECLKQEEVSKSPGKRQRNSQTEEDIVQGIELLAQAIDSIVMRVQVKLSNTTIRLEYLPGLEPRGLALEVQVGKIIYSGEIGAEQNEAFSTSTVRKIFFEEVGIFSDEFNLRSHSHSEGSGDESSSPDKKLDPDSEAPLKLAALTGRQELLVKFTDTNQFGLPRAVDEVEINFGILSVHLFPHQIHILSEILAAVTVPPQPQQSVVRPPGGRQPARHLVKGLEGLLQDNLRLGLDESTGIRQGWGGDISASREFMPVSGLTSSRVQGYLTDEGRPADSPASSPPVPRILVKLAGLTGVLVERDDGVSRMGGEASRSLAMEVMRAATFNYFNRVKDMPQWEPRKLFAWHKALAASLSSSHIQLVASPVSVVYEEGTSIGPGLASNYAAITTVTVGKLSVMEGLMECDAKPGTPIDMIHLLKFTSNTESTDAAFLMKKKPDVKLIYKDTFDSMDNSPVSNISVNLNSCTVDLDPGLVDRIYLLLNYSDMDPECLRTVLTPKDSNCAQSLSLQLNCPHLTALFHIPRPDMRHPTDIGPEFIKTFWTRKVHPEVFEIQTDEFSLKVEQEGGYKPPVRINVMASTVECLYQESPDTQQFSLIQARRIQQSREKHKKCAALDLSITVCQDEGQKLQGRFSSRQHFQKKERKPSLSPEDGIDADSYFVVDPDSGLVSSGVGQVGFIQQLPDMLAALQQAALRNNLLIDIKLDAVSLVMPSKRLYEVIYNRLGNDMLLWLPAYMAVREHLYGEKLEDPLHDDTGEFSGCFSGVGHQGPEDPTPRVLPTRTNAFPRDNSSNNFEIHTDTAVLLKVNQAQALVCLPISDSSDGGEESSNSTLGLVHVTAIGLNLTSSVGLDKDPEISIFTLRCMEGCVKYGLCNKGCLPAQLHFNPDIEVLDVLVTTNSYCDRAWPSRTPESDLLNLTGKVLLDTASNLKSIQLAFKFVSAGVCVREPATGPDWVDAIADFFTVVEFPVLGYLPPAVLTELHFQLSQCAIELAPPSVSPTRAALAIGRANVSCSLLDTTQDASVSVSIEDAGVYISKDSVSPTDTAVCVADIDYLDLSVILSDNSSPTIDGVDVPIPPPRLNVTASANMVRIRTCADTIQLLAELAGGLAASTVEEESRESSVEPDVQSAPEHNESDNMLPDLEDAMEELETDKISATEPRKEKPTSHQPVNTSPGAQVFFFPDESNPSMTKSRLPENLAMSQSFYVDPAADPHDESADSSDLESFCILGEEEGSGIMSSAGVPTVRCLDPEGVTLIDNHFKVPNAAMDYLKPPKEFPLPQAKISLTKMSLVWQIFGGNDFSNSKEMRSNTKSKLEKMGMSVTSINCDKTKQSKKDAGTAVGSARKAADSLKTRGGPGRNSDLLIEVAITKMAAQHEAYLPTTEVRCPISRQLLLIPCLEIRDRLKISEINKLLYPYSSRIRPRQSSSHMLNTKCLTVRPDPDSDLEESSIKVSLQPFRINIDQDTLFFLIDFFNTLVPQEPEVPGELQQQTKARSSSTEPGQSIRYSSGMQAIEIEVPEGSEVFEDARSSPPRKESGEETTQTTPRSLSSTPAPGSAASNIYIRSFEFSPSVPIRIDYVGKYVDLTQGALTGILAGLGQLNCSELTLRQLHYKQGILGVDKLLAAIVTAWLSDIRSTQLPAILGGVGPMHAFLQLLSGIRDLVLLPIEQYRKDGRIIRGLQKGTNSFTHSTTLSFLDVTNKMLTVIKFMAEMAFDVMSPDGCVVQGKFPHPPSQSCRRRAGRAGRRRARGTPADVREGMLGAMALVRDGLDETARSLAEAASGDLGAVGGVLRAVPSTMVRPVILASAATSNLLDGVKNQISPDQRAEEEDKWRTFS